MSVLKWGVGWRLFIEFQFYGHEVWLFITFNVKESGTNYVPMAYEKFIPSKHISFYCGFLVVNFETRGQGATSWVEYITSSLWVNSSCITHICKHSTMKPMLIQLGKIMQLQRETTWQWNQAYLQETNICLGIQGVCYVLLRTTIFIAIMNFISGTVGIFFSFQIMIWVKVSLHNENQFAADNVLALLFVFCLRISSLFRLWQMVLN